MSKQNMFTDLVFGLSDKEFSLLQGAVSMRLNKERYGATTFNELAVKYKRMPSCPDCGSEESIKSSLTPDGIQNPKVYMQRLRLSLQSAEQYNLSLNKQEL